jgi:hypothetical protein
LCFLIDIVVVSVFLHGQNTRPQTAPHFFHCFLRMLSLCV